MAALCMIKPFWNLFVRQIGMLKTRFLLKAISLELPGLIRGENECTERIQPSEPPQ